MLAGIILSVVLSTTIITGDSYSKSTVTNEVNGGNVYTRIEVEANGEKKVLESSEAGKYEVEVKSSGSKTSGVSIKSTISATSSATSSVSGKTSGNIKTRNILGNILDNIMKILSKIFRLGS